VSFSTINSSNDRSASSSGVDEQLQKEKRRGDGELRAVRIAFTKKKSSFFLISLDNVVRHLMQGAVKCKSKE
jgi:hypothetical protein